MAEVVTEALRGLDSGGGGWVPSGTHSPAPPPRPGVSASDPSGGGRCAYAWTLYSCEGRRPTPHQNSILTYKNKPESLMSELHAP